MEILNDICDSIYTIIAPNSAILLKEEVATNQMYFQIEP